jgi:hypothetical protein
VRDFVTAKMCRWRDRGGTYLMVKKTQWRMLYWYRDGSGTSILDKKTQWRMHY